MLDFLAHLEFERGLVAQHARRLPHRPAPVRRASWRSAGATRRTREPRDVSDFLAELAAGDGNGAPALLAGDDQPQGGLPALLLPPPAPRGADRRRSDGDARRRRARASKLPAGAEPRARSQQLLDQPQGQRADRPARPGAAGADVRVRACALRRRSASSSATSTSTQAFVRAHGKGSKERLVPLGGKAVGRGQRLSALRAPEAGRRQRRAQALRQLPRRPADPPGALQDHPAPRQERGARGQDEPAHAAPHLRHTPADRRLRPALGPGDAGPRRLSTTQLYTHLSGEELKEVYFKAHPAGSGSSLGYMPELPEVETIRRQLEPEVAGRTIVARARC